MVTIYNSFSQIHLHNTNAFFEDLTGKDFYNLADKLFTYILIFQCRIRISQLAKYYKVIFENCKACRGAPTMVQCDFWRFWNVYSPKTSKAVFWDVPCINKKAIGVSKYIILWQRFVLICHRKNSTGHQGWSKHNSIWVAPPSFPTLVN